MPEVIADVKRFSLRSLKDNPGIGTGDFLRPVPLNADDAWIAFENEVAIGPLVGERVDFPAGMVGIVGGRPRYQPRPPCGGKR